MHDPSAVTTFLFTDIEGSTRLWEEMPERMRPALARHDALSKAAVEGHGGFVVKMTGDGVHAAFDDPCGAVAAALEIQRVLAADNGDGLALAVRCGLHVGVVERRDNDFFGSAVNRAARIMSVAHGGQVLLSDSVATLIRDRLPADAALRDLGSARLRDLAQPERIHQLLHPALRRDFPALRSLETTPNNLPQQVTSFVGREREVAHLKTLLRQNRLLTLVGTGGLGKTRLSLQVAADIADRYPDGTWFIELAPVSDPELVPQVVASTLGVKEEAGRPLVDALAKHLGDRQMLLVLDNCEHLIDACAALVAQLLRTSAQLTILASSRERLRVAGETVFPVPILPVPDPTHSTAPAELQQFESVRLFVERATAAHPSFAVTPHNARAVATLCHRLDGIPLALELAAARIRAISVENIAARLDDRFRLLSRGDPTALPRQRTLRALIDWSYELLEEDERAFFRRISVFAGGFMLDAALQVGAGTEFDPLDVLDLVTRLVEKSLVAADAEGARYRLLETVRQYATERLNETSEGDVVRNRHLVHYAALADEARVALTGPEQAQWLVRIDQERENVLAAHAWAAMPGAIAGNDLRLVNGVKQYWISRGLIAPGYRIVAEALAQPSAMTHDVPRARTLVTAGQLCCLMHRYAEARAHLEESLAIGREIGDTGRVAAALQFLALAALGQGDSAKARHYLEEALALAQSLGNRREVAAALNALAQVHRAEGAFDVAEPLYRRVVDLARELVDREVIGIGLLNLAMVSIVRGRVDEAAGMLQEVIAAAEDSGSKPLVQSALEVTAGLAAARDDDARAARLYGAAEAMALRTGIRRDPADEAFLSPWISQARSRLGAQAFNIAELEGRALALEDALGEARAAIAVARIEPRLA